MVELETPRLVVRGFRPEDWRDLQEYVALEEVTRYDHAYPSGAGELRDLAAYFARNEGFWAVTLQGQAQVIGHIVARQNEPQALRTWHLGFVFNPEFQGQGYATEGCRRVLQYLFGEQAAHRVEATCAADNDRSWRLLERLGMRREAHHRQAGFFHKDAAGAPIWVDSYEYAILAEEWR